MGRSTLRQMYCIRMLTGYVPSGCFGPSRQPRFNEIHSKRPIMDGRFLYHDGKNYFSVQQMGLLRRSLSASRFGRIMILTVPCQPVPVEDRQAPGSAAPWLTGMQKSSLPLHQVADDPAGDHIATRRVDRATALKWGCRKTLPSGRTAFASWTLHPWWR